MPVYPARKLERAMKVREVIIRAMSGQNIDYRPDVGFLLTAGQPKYKRNREAFRQGARMVDFPRSDSLRLRQDWRFCRSDCTAVF